MFSRASKLIGLSTTLILSACLRLPATEAPIPHIKTTGDEAANKTLVIMLPGRAIERRPSSARDSSTFYMRRHTRETGTPVFLGYGCADNLASAYDPLLDALEPTRVFARDGEHKWTTWTPIWASIASQLQTSP